MGIKKNRIVGQYMSLFSYSGGRKSMTDFRPTVVESYETFAEGGQEPLYLYGGAVKEQKMPMVEAVFRYTADQKRNMRKYL